LALASGTVSVARAERRRRLLKRLRVGPSRRAVVGSSDRDRETSLYNKSVILASNDNIHDIAV
jgi:hypothetical protein